MISTTFETKRFRVQITGKTVWVESSEGAGWIFRNQHSLPIAPEALRGRSDSSVLRAAVQHFERTHGGDTSLRQALTGISFTSAVPQAAKAQQVAPVIADKRHFTTRSPLKSVIPANRFRTALRPPLMTQG